jgi:hypothetical protein
MKKQWIRPEMKNLVVKSGANSLSNENSVYTGVSGGPV